MIAGIVDKTKLWLKMTLSPDGSAYAMLRWVYSRTFFRFERWRWRCSSGGFESASSLHMCSLLPRRTLDVVLNSYKPKTWLDVGCGTGASLKYVKKQGVKVAGIEFSSLAIKESGIPECIIQGDLTKAVSMGRQFDVVWCYEVAEHLSGEFSDVFVNTLCQHVGTVLVFSAAHPGQGGDGHVNEQPKEYWVEKFRRAGFRIDAAMTAEINALRELYSDNLICFLREERA